MARMTIMQYIAAPLARPWVVLVTLPILMLAVVAFFVMGTENALVGLASKANRARLQTQNQNMGEAVNTLTKRAVELMPAMESAARQYLDGADNELLAWRLSDLMSGSDGVAWLIVALPDGRFFAAHRDHRQEGGILFSVRHPEQGGRVYRLDSSERLREVSHDPDLRYDPRERDFYDLALRSESLAWTEPYLFFTDQVPGVSCVQALRDDGAEVAAVLSVEMDLLSLSHSLSTSVSHPQARAVLSAGDQVLAAVLPDGLALPSGERLPRLEDLPDRVLQTYAKLAQSKKGPALLSFLAAEGDDAAAEVEYMVESQHHPGPNGDWQVAQIIPRSVIEEPVRETVERSRLVAFAGAGVAMVLAMIYAFALVDANRRVRRAEASAAKAKSDMRQIGAYYLVRLLGAGGMGAVWLARHHFLAKPAAMKFILPEAQSVDEHSVQRFKHEARVLAHLQSRHTIRVYDFGQTPDGRLFYVMEMLDGVDLDQLVTKYGPQPAGRVLAILRQACASLAEAHHRGLVHRDIKPGNIFICRMADELDVVKILDFGLVTGFQANKRMTQQGMVQGTPEFMSPEQAQDDPVDGRADLYALGCVAYWLLTGRPPFEAANPMKILLQHIEAEPPNLTMSAGLNVPIQMETLIHWCLAKDPARRPQSAEELRAALDDIDVGTSDSWSSAHREQWWAQIPLPDYSIDDQQKLTTGEAIMVHGPLS